MVAYVGSKIVLASPMTCDAAHTWMGRPIPPGADPNELGYAVLYPDGYRSWSPKAVFEEAYRGVSDGERELLT